MVNTFLSQQIVKIAPAPIWLFEKNEKPEENVKKKTVFIYI